MTILFVFVTGGDVPPHETSLLSNLTDEGLDLSQRTITESIFQGPDLDTEGEELLTGKTREVLLSCKNPGEMLVPGKMRGGVIFR